LIRSQLNRIHGPNHNQNTLFCLGLHRGGAKTPDWKIEYQPDTEADLSRLRARAGMADRMALELRSIYRRRDYRGWCWVPDVQALLAEYDALKGDVEEEQT